MTQTAVHILHTPGDLAGNILSFRRHLAAGNLSPTTIKTYSEAATKLAEFLVANGMPTDAARIRREHLETFVQDQLDRWKPATALNRFAGIRVFFKWLADEGEIKADRNPVSHMKPPRVPEPVTPIVRVEDLDKLLRTCAGQDFESRRDMAVLRVYMMTGARRAEVANLRLVPEDPEHNDLDLELGQLRIQGKGGRDRITGLDPKTVKALDRYLRVRTRHSQAHLTWLWLGKKGRFTEDGIRQMIERRAGQAGVEHIHPHQFRHTFAHYWMASGGSETDLMRIAGWRSRTMLSRYAASAAQERAIAASKRTGLASRL